MPLNLKKNIFPLSKHNRLENPNWQAADQLTISKHDQVDDLGSTETQLLISSLRGHVASKMLIKLQLDQLADRVSLQLWLFDNHMNCLNFEWKYTCMMCLV